ncbi:MAG TPA: hypothetical protein PKB06_08165, partial [Actinotalea sp.]|nr:hypothetical protein [Actinotalea sp.]
MSTDTGAFVTLANPLPAFGGQDAEDVEAARRDAPQAFRTQQRAVTAADYAAAVPAELEELIRSAGFYRAKARALIGLGQALVERFDGQVPRRMRDLVTLPGVGRKTANVVLGNAFAVPGLPVDTHVLRVAGRLG